MKIILAKIEHNQMMEARVYTRVLQAEEQFKKELEKLWPQARRYGCATKEFYDDCWQNKSTCLEMRQAIINGTTVQLFTVGEGDK